MSPEDQIEPSREILLPQQVWETLNLTQQQTVLQAVISLCQHIIEMWYWEESNEQPSVR
jgi:hypothetical protein